MPLRLFNPDAIEVPESDPAGESDRAFFLRMIGELGTAEVLRRLGEPLSHAPSPIRTRRPRGPA